ncbi:hypothetical protein PTI98_012285 [Pleurotus ostreatus]|nr:hypothetical protein PTI98_012285 [Pleurotus ostreatus]
MGSTYGNTFIPSLSFTSELYRVYFSIFRYRHVSLEPDDTDDVWWWWIWEFCDAIRKVSINFSMVHAPINSI